MDSLARLLFAETRPEFFRVLSGQLATVYVDALDRLEREASQRNHGLARSEALAIVEDVVQWHTALELATDEEDYANSSTKGKAGIVLETLKASGWLLQEERADYQQVVQFEPAGVVLLSALRRIAFPEAAFFSDKVVNVCVTLIHRDALAEQPWAQIESCVNNLKEGLTELRGMQKSIERHTKQQLKSDTLKENLSLLFDKFSEGVGRNCYAQLVQARLPSKLASARQSLEGLRVNGGLLGSMQTEVMRREPTYSSETAMARVHVRLNELHELLNQVEPLAEAIDRRTAEFARRSQARFSYLQETASANRGHVQDFFQMLNTHFTGWRLNQIESLELDRPSLMVHDIRVLAGHESLYAVRLRQALGEIAPLDDSDQLTQERSLQELAKALHDSPSVGRANYFVSRLPGDRGTRIDSNVVLRDYVNGEDDMVSLLACLLHGQSSEARYKLEVPRWEEDTDEAEFDTGGGYNVERFTLIKK